MAAVKAVISENQLAVCPTVIHFARFEKPFLKDFHQKNDPESPFPFQIICTHEIAVRLLPDLPRRGLRAIAGYFGHSMPELRRSADHVQVIRGIGACRNDSRRPEPVEATPKCRALTRSCR